MKDNISIHTSYNECTKNYINNSIKKIGINEMKERIIKLTNEIINLINQNIVLTQSKLSISRGLHKDLEYTKNQFKEFMYSINNVNNLYDLLNISIPCLIDDKEVIKALKWNKKMKKEAVVVLNEKLKNNYKIINDFYNKLKIELYKEEYHQFESIEKFIIRKKFIYYMLYLAEIIKKDPDYNEKDELKALTHNILADVEKIVKEDSWILGDNKIKEYLYKKNVKIIKIKEKTQKELIDEKKYILDSIKSVNKDIDFIINLKIHSNIKSKLETDDELKEMINTIDNILFSFIEFYDGTQDAYGYFDDLEEIKKIFNLLGYRYKKIKDCEEYGVAYADKLDLELCQTLDIVEINNEEDIEKEFKIRKVYRDAIVKENMDKKREVIRKALVSVYRLILE